MMVPNTVTRVLAAGVLTLVTASAGAAQSYATDRGSFVLGGTASYTSSGGELYENADGDRHNSVLVNPFGMYFFVPGLALGGQVSIQHDSQGDASVTILGVGPSAAYYFGGPDSQIYPYLGAGISYEMLSSEVIDANGLSIGGEAGVAVMLSQAVALFVETGYTVQTLSVDQFDDSASGNRFRFQAGVGAFIF